MGICFLYGQNGGKRGGDVVKPLLPEGYAQLTYIESTGTQYIDTGVIGNQDTRVVMEATIPSSRSGACFLFGARSTSSAGRFTAYAGSTYFGFGYDTAATNTSVEVAIGTKYSIDYNKNVITIDGISKSATASTFSTTYPMYLFCENQVGEAKQFLGYSLYSCQIYDNDKLVRDYIPCINPSGEVGLYDKVGKEFYSNMGTGTFIQGDRVVKLPEGYTQVEYIESTGTQYIDTGFAPSNTTRVTAKMSVTSFSSNSWLLGSKQTDSSGRYTVYVLTTGALYFGYNTGGVSVTTISTNKIYNIDYNKNQCTVNGVTASASEVSFQNTYPLYIFAEDNVGTAASLSSAKLYACQIYDNGTLVRDYTPCINANGVAGLYDLVSATFYQNAGSGAFKVPVKMPTGYTAVNYLQSTGTQYINTGCLPTGTMKIELVVSDWAANSSTTTIYGSHTMLGNKYDLYASNNSYISNYNMMVTANFGSSVSCVNKSTIVRDGKNITINGTTLTNNTTFDMPGEVPLYLFAHNNNGTATQHASAKIYSCQISDGGTLLRDYVPCTNENSVAGLYDLANGVFYPNMGSGSFTTG